MSLTPDLLRAARGIAQVLADAGYQAWIVGGAPRDLALGRPPHDVDLASAARPEEVERLFRKTVAVGKAFGTVVVRDFGMNVEVTTFRSDGSYTDGRRPDAVEYGTDPAMDARRRDFTCNALYLDPLTDELFDPEGGLADLDLGLLRCVGCASARFREDGLRLLRLVRLVAQLGLEPEEDTLAAVAVELDALRGVSSERILSELERMFSAEHAVRAVALALETGLYARVLPIPKQAEHAASAFASLGPSFGCVRGLALAAALGGLRASSDARALLETLHCSRELRRRVLETLDSAAGIERLVRGPEPVRSVLIRLLRANSFSDGCAVARALEVGPGGERDAYDALCAQALEFEHTELFPVPFLRSEDLEASGLPRGPRWSAAFEELERLQLDGELVDRAQALEWLQERVRSGA